MRDLSLHILDLVENSLRAEATIIAVTVAADAKSDKLCVVIEDNGRGLSVTPEQALDPFYTTKSGKRTGLGLSFFRETAERAGGKLTIGCSDLGGVKVAAEMGLGHVDRSPMGDLAATLASLVCVSPKVDFRLRLCGDGHEACLNVAEAAREEGIDADDGLALARLVTTWVQAEQKAMKILT